MPAEYGTGRLSPNVGKKLSLISRVITQKSAVASEASNHARYKGVSVNVKCVMDPETSHAPFRSVKEWRFINRPYCIRTRL